MISWKYQYEVPLERVTKAINTLFDTNTMFIFNKDNIYYMFNALTFKNFSLDSFEGVTKVEVWQKKIINNGGKL